MSHSRTGLPVLFLITLLIRALVPMQAAPAATAGDAAPAVDYAGFIDLGGLEQWVTIRGDSDENPILLVVHGGPGDPLSPFVPQFAPYEHDFTVVQWDQRGAGRTFGRNGPDTPDANLERVARDGVELADYLLKRFGKRKLLILGHSWGSVVAMQMVQQRPALFSAYIGTGQVSSSAAIRAAQADFVRAVANVRGDEELKDNLAVIATLDGTDPETIYANLPILMNFNRAMRSHLNPSDTLWLSGLEQRLKGLVSAEDLAQANEGMNFSGGAYLKDSLAEDLFATASRVAVPVYVIQGKDDLFTPTAPALAWFERVEAPAKQVWIIEDAGHFALVTHQQPFLDALKAIRRQTAGH